MLANKKQTEFVDDEDKDTTKERFILLRFNNISIYLNLANKFISNLELNIKIYNYDNNSFITAGIATNI